ncbi:MAG TPA: hypothetical protein VJL08_02905 [Dehalococcoidia bacterium]|nr:hypothetical protein [Dehalococcoidia bacterium]
MAFPSVHYGSPGDEKVTSSTKIGSLPLGTKMIIGDREFMHGRAGGTVLVAGKLYESGSSISASDTMYAKSLVLNGVHAVGAVSVAFTSGGSTAVTTDQFEDGWLTTAGSVGTGIGYTHMIKTNNSAASGSATCTLTLWDTDGLKVATNASTLVGVRENAYRLTKLTTADTAGAGKVVGVACNSAAASSYAWFQVKGPGPVFVGGTVLAVGEPVVCSTAVAGAAVPIVASTAGPTSAKAMITTIGTCLQSAGTGSFALVDLNIV